MEARFDAINFCEKSIDQIGQSVEAGNEHREVEKATTKLENLPLPLIHHIMDSLSSKDSTKFSILSKTFNSSWLTYPVLNFDNALFPIQHPHAFNAFVHRTFQLRAPHILGCLHKLRFCYKVHLRFFIYDFKPLVTELLYFASHNNCKVLDFEIDMIVSQSLSIPFNALHPMLSSKFLTTLKLSGFTLPIPDPVITCPALKLLSITFCIGFQTLHVVSPSLMEVEIILCQELKSVIVDSDEIECFKFTGVPRSRRNIIKPCDIIITLAANQYLKSMYLENVIVSEALMGVATKILHVRCCNLAKNMKIYNPNMEILQLENCGVVENLVVSAPNIEHFKYSKGAIITDGWVKSVVSALACLKELKILSCNMLEKIEFKNARLETLVVETCSKLKEAMVDAPNLLHFTYFGSVNVYPLLILSAKCDAKITLELIFPREFMLKNMVSPLHDVKHVIVKVGEILRGCTVPSLVESLLWLAPKPDILTLESSLKRKKSTIKFKFRWNAQKMDKEEDNCCVGLLIKCWRHYDLHIEYEGFDDNNGGNQLREYFASYL
ncbi:F-box domain, cyclin-like protein [Senna tora]|uniref:F-box domain, cyclin-like protein n=1 Tax=Senna tora TaxID=362788 RepID=A0A834TL74_9FABA|nr:F-box domain, cyclin-like protein [Senna tora]